MPELWVGIIFEERVMESTAAERRPLPVPVTARTGRAFDIGRVPLYCALHIEAQFIIHQCKPGGEMHAPSGRSHLQIINSAGQHPALCPL
jgi:hypothetical protein